MASDSSGSPVQVEPNLVQPYVPGSFHSDQNTDCMQAIEVRVLPASLFALISVMLAACASPQPVIKRAVGGETFYVSMLGTRKHRLSGVNPVVGLFLTKDGGETWRQTGWEQGKAFAATVPRGGQGDSIFVAAGNGVMRSMDGGASWRITTGWEVTEVQDVAVSAMRKTDVFAATPYGIFRSRDFGSTWSHVADNLVQPYVASIRVDRGEPDHVVAGTEGGLYLSADGGDTWMLTSLHHAVRSVRQSPDDANTWAAALQDHGVAISSDGGSTWTLGADLEGRTVYEVEFDPMHPARLLAGGWKTGLFETRDLGGQWTRIDEDLPTEDIHGISLSRVQAGLVILGTLNEGVFISKDGGRRWTAADPTIFEAGQVWDVYIGGEE